MVEVSEDSKENMLKLAGLLPDGKTCFDCKHLSRCEWIDQIDPENKYCTFNPMRFVEK